MIFHKRDFMTALLVILVYQNVVTACDDNDDESAQVPQIRIEETHEFKVCKSHLGHFCDQILTDALGCARVLFNSMHKKSPLYCDYERGYYWSFYNNFVTSLIEDPAKFCKKYESDDQEETSNSYKTMYIPEYVGPESVPEDSDDEYFANLDKHEKLISPYAEKNEAESSGSRQYSLSCKEQLKEFGVTETDAVHHAFYYTVSENHGIAPKFDFIALDYIGHIISKVRLNKNQKSPIDYCRKIVKKGILRQDSTSNKEYYSSDEDTKNLFD